MKETYTVLVDGVEKLETGSRLKAERYYAGFFDSKGRLKKEVETVELRYPDWKED